MVTRPSSLLQMGKLMVKKIPRVTQLKHGQVQVQTQEPVPVAPVLEYDTAEGSPGPREIHAVTIHTVLDSRM